MAPASAGAKFQNFLSPQNFFPPNYNQISIKARTAQVTRIAWGKLGIANLLIGACQFANREIGDPGKPRLPLS
jgi:hypothetical protein